ncbi:MAG: hypothetical protein H6905_06830 [Hyphomicrobiales bacterium]|nr:hypothetical protein [Hyphomicrobiales bacterium]
MKIIAARGAKPAQKEPVKMSNPWDKILADKGLVGGEQNATANASAPQPRQSVAAVWERVLAEKGVLDAAAKPCPPAF